MRDVDLHRGCVRGLAKESAPGAEWLSPLPPIPDDGAGRVASSRRQSAFLRRWYPFWEAMLHGIIDDFDTWDPGLDLLPEALEAYPDDSEILLGAGARYELLWWRLAENAHRSLVGGQFSSRDRLVRASEYLRRSIAANPAETEARLRLARVLDELGEYREGLAVIAGDDWKSESVFEYLARMVEGDLYERLGDTGAAAAAYDKAIPLVRVPQSARIAIAFLEHQSGARQEAVEEILRATSLPLDENDRGGFTSAVNSGGAKRISSGYARWCCLDPSVLQGIRLLQLRADSSPCGARTRADPPLSHGGCCRARGRPGH